MIASKESIAHMQSPWPCPLRVLRRDGRKQREERREKRANGRQLDSLHFYRAPWPPRKSFENQRGPPKWPRNRFTAFLQCPVSTSTRGEKTATSLRGSFPKSIKNQRVPRRWPRARIIAFSLCPVTTSLRAKTRSKKSS